MCASQDRTVQMVSKLILEIWDNHTYRHPVARHVHQLFLIFDEPSLGLELVSVRPPNSSVMVLSPAVNGDGGLRKNNISVHAFFSDEQDTYLFWEELSGNGGAT